MKILLYSLVLFLVGLAFISPVIFGQDLLLWDENRPLTWNDFQGVPGIFPQSYTGSKDDFTAFTWTWLSADWQFQKTDSSVCQYEFTSVDGMASFDKSASWVRERGLTDQELLEHEQGHFDIAEIHARKLESELLGKQFSCPNGIFDVDKINQKTNDFFNQILEEFGDMNSLYDIETDHYNNKEKQLEWNEKLKSILNSFETEPISSKSKIPDWVRNIFVWYGQNKIGEEDLLNAIQFLIREGIIKVS